MKSSEEWAADLGVNGYGKIVERIQADALLHAAKLAETCLTESDIEEFTGAGYAAEKIREYASQIKTK